MSSLPGSIRDDPRWPNFFLIGAAKAGTTSLHRYLDEHPEIFMSPVKETYFFSETLDELEDDPEALDDAIEDYLALFGDAGDAPVRGESTPGYLWWESVPERIEAHVDDPRFAVSLRDPVERAYSDYWMARRKGLEDRSFLERVRDELDALEPREHGFVAPGLYHRHLERYVDRFGRESLHVVLIEQMKQDPLGVLQGLARFLDVDPEAMAEVDYETVHNPHGVPKNPLAGWLRESELVARASRLVLPERVRIYLGEHVLVEKQEKPPIDPEARAVLEEVYEPEIAALEKMIGRDLPELRSSW